MSEEQKDKKPLTLSKEVLQKQIQQANAFVQAAQQQIAKLQGELQQNLGIAAYAQHLLNQFDIPEESKKTPLEVK